MPGQEISRKSDLLLRIRGDFPGFPGRLFRCSSAFFSVSGQEITRNPRGARLVASITMLISRCPVQVSASWFVSCVQNSSMVFLNGLNPVRVWTCRCRLSDFPNRSGFSRIHTFSNSAPERPIERPSSRKARRYPAGISGYCPV